MPSIGHTSFPRRSLRRQFVVLALVCLTVIFAGRLRILVFGPHVANNIPFAQPIASGEYPTGGYQQPKQRLSSYILEQHKYLPNGLLQVNNAGPHPIYELIRRSERNWASKHSRASTNLREAISEYKRRYHRSPPRGFDHWWAYVEANNVLLPDEYDQIFRDIQPLWGVPPGILQNLQREWEGHADSFTIGKNMVNEPISLLNFTLPGNETSHHDMAEGAVMLIDLLEQVQHHIPPFRAIFSPHDNPNLFTDFELRQLALNFAAQGKVISILHRRQIQTKLDGWISACSTSSAAWQKAINWYEPPYPTLARPKSFIYDHRAGMDPCQHPHLFQQHGQFLSHKKGPIPDRDLIPQFSYSPTLGIHSDITAAVPHGWISDLSPSDNLAWDFRTDERLYWRGRNTGIWHDEEAFWRSSHRIRMIEWALQGLEGNATFLPPPRSELEKIGEGISVKKSRYAPAMLDIAFAGEPLNCPPQACELLRKRFEFRKFHTLQDAGKYRYVLDMDGNGWSSRFKRLMTSNALVFKATIYPEWFTDRVQPWVHYAPVQIDLSDLWDSLIFFRGDLNGENAHEGLAKKIALAGREWSLKYWRAEDMVAYNFRLFLEYARVMSPDRESMSFEYQDDR